MADREAELRRAFAAIKQDLNDGELVKRALQLCGPSQAPADLAIKWESFLINEKVGPQAITAKLMDRFSEWLKTNAVARSSKQTRRAFAGNCYSRSRHAKREYEVALKRPSEEEAT